MNEKEKELVEQNIKFAYWKASKWTKNTNNPNMTDDFISLCVFGMIKAAHTMDETKKIKFTTYANVCMDNEVLLFLRKNSKTAIPFSCIGDYTNENGDRIDIERVIDFEYKYDDDTNEIDVNEIVNKLPDREFNVVFMYYFCSYKEYEIAAIISTSQSNVSRIKRRGIKLLKNMLKNFK